MKRSRIIHLIVYTLILCTIIYIYIRANLLFRVAMNIPQLHNGDAKFFNNSIITSLNGSLTIYDINGSMVASYPDVMTNWIDGLADEGIIVYGNGNKQIGIVQLDDDFKLLSNEIIMETDNLQIDPTIIKVQDTYYITVTEIEGTVNNADINSENGIYTVHLYQSTDLSNWQYVTDVVTANNNIEDIDVRFWNDRFVVLYEKENVDKGDSAIYVTISTDDTGKQFGEEKELISANCYHEPASIEQTTAGYRLYYSCDKDNRGTSYQGASAYYADFDENWNLKDKDKRLYTQFSDGILLYDVQYTQKGIRLLYARNYLTDCDMIVEERGFYDSRVMGIRNSNGLD